MVRLRYTSVLENVLRMFKAVPGFNPNTVKTALYVTLPYIFGILILVVDISYFEKFKQFPRKNLYEEVTCVVCPLSWSMHSKSST